MPDMTSPQPAQWSDEPLRPLPDFVPFSPPSVGDAEIKEVVDTLTSGWLTTGPKTEAFENALKKRVGAEHAVAVNSCTAALHLALHALDIGPEDGVITSPYTFASTGHVILYQGAQPFFVDVEFDTFNMDPAKLSAFLETQCRWDGPNKCLRHRHTGRIIKAVLPVHYGGHPCRMDEIIELARAYDLFVIEDAAHAIGAQYKNRPVGSLGDITCFSFYATKNLTTGEGGMAMTGLPDVAERMRVLSMYGISDARRIWKRYAPKGSWVYDVRELGFKYNMMDIQAALGIHQLKRLDEFIARREENADIYNLAFDSIPGVRIPIVEPYAHSAWHLYPILLDPDILKITRDQFIEELKTLNIGTSVLFIPLHLHSYYQRTLPYKEGDFPVAEALFRRVVNLPVSPALSPQTAHRVAETVAALIRRNV
jgi:dTDP-4-amino-4,6-dideoxygalactose transaminase